MQLNIGKNPLKSNILVTTNLIKKRPLAGEIYEHRQALAAINGATKWAELGAKEQHE
jgi:hypothetical protein